MDTTKQEHLKPYEPAARIYCAKIGADPDQAVRVPHPVFPGAAIQVPRWAMEAERLVDFSLMLTALKEAARVPTAPKIVVQ